MTDVSGPTCDYCGLQVPRRRGTSYSGPIWCCFGCRFAQAVTQARGEQGAVNWALTRLGLAAFLTMNVMVFTMALWTQDVYGQVAEGASDGVLRGVFRYLCLLFALPVLLLLGGPLAENAWSSWRRGVASTDGLLLVGVAASYLYSVVSVWRDRGPVYFEVGCVVLLLVTLGRWLEATSKLRTTAAIESLHALLPEHARVLRDSGEESVPCTDVCVGERVRVLAGEHFPTDGLVERGTALVDEQVLSGESQPVARAVGEQVWGGTVNLDGDLIVRVTAPARGGAVARLVELVRAARASKGHYERLADRVTSLFLPAVILVAAGTTAWHARGGRLDEGILAGLAVLLIACPCALGLATPMAVWAALGRAARQRVLFQSGEALERLASVRAVRFDKTGTLTTGYPVVADCVVAEGADPTEVLELAGGLAASSTHTVAGAVLRHAQYSGSKCGAPVDDVRALPGRGVMGRLPGGATVLLGSVRFMEESGLAWGPRLSLARDAGLAQRTSLTCLGWEGYVRALFVLWENLRPGAATAILALESMGCDVAVLTGDHAARGATVARQLGVPVQADLLPQDKVAAVEEARSRIGPVALVGDGINDAPALAASDVGIALGCGADVSRGSATVCLLSDDPVQVPWAIELARRTVRVIRQNLFWAFAYNVAGVGLACTGRLNPALAALAMALSSFLVVTNSLRLTAAHPQGHEQAPPLPTEVIHAPSTPLGAQETQA